MMILGGMRALGLGLLASTSLFATTAEAGHVVWLRFKEGGTIGNCVEQGQKAVFKEIEKKKGKKSNFLKKVQGGRKAYPLLHKKPHATVIGIKNYKTKDDKKKVHAAIKKSVDKVKNVKKKSRKISVQGAGNFNMYFKSDFFAALTRELASHKGLFTAAKTKADDQHIGIFYGKGKWGGAFKNKFNTCFAKHKKKGLTVASVEVYDVSARKNHPEWRGGFYPEGWYRKFQVKV